MRSLGLLCAAVVVLALSAGHASARSLLATGPKYATVLDMVKARNDMKVLLALANATGMDHTPSDLVGTFFFPTDKAFAAFFKKTELTLEDVLANRQKVMGLLGYHVHLGDAFFKKDAVNGAKLLMSIGQNVTLYRKKGLVLLEDTQSRIAHVTKADITAGEAVIHVIDKVLLPDLDALPDTPVGPDGPGSPPGPDSPSEEGSKDFPDIISALSSKGLTTLRDLVQYADLTAQLGPNKTFTLFAPSNQAFIDLYTRLGISSTDPPAKDLVQNLLSYHIVAAKVKAAELAAAGSTILPTVLGLEVEVIKEDDGLVVHAVASNGKIIEADIMAGKDAIIHIIDTILLPIPV